MVRIRPLSVITWGPIGLKFKKVVPTVPLSMLRSEFESEHVCVYFCLSVPFLSPVR